MKKTDEFKLGDMKGYKDGLLSSVLKRKGYVFKKWLTLSPLLIAVFMLSIIVVHDGWGMNVYVECPRDELLGCYNPYYNQCNPIMMPCIEEKARSTYCATHKDLCIFEILPPGYTYGKPPSPIYERFFEILFISIIIAYVANHVLFNRSEQRKRRMIR